MAAAVHTASRPVSRPSLPLPIESDDIRRCRPALPRRGESESGRSVGFPKIKSERGSEAKRPERAA